MTLWPVDELTMTKFIAGKQTDNDVIISLQN